MSERKRIKRRDPVHRPSFPSPANRDKRFNQLLDIARGGNAEAAADLLREYEFRFGEDEP